MFANFDHLIRVYGWLAVFLGAALEGEAAVTAGGFMAHRQLIDPFVVAISACTGSIAADQIVFLLARLNRGHRLVQSAEKRPAFARAVGFIDHHPVLFCTVFRFIYGMRTAGPIAIGLSQIPARQFVLLNVLSAAIWASVFTFIGYRFGNAFEKLIGRVISSRWAIGGALAVIAIAAIVLFIHRRRSARHSPD